MMLLEVACSNFWQHPSASVPCFGIPKSKASCLYLYFVTVYTIYQDLNSYSLSFPCAHFKTTCFTTSCSEVYQETWSRKGGSMHNLYRNRPDRLWPPSCEERRTKRWRERYIFTRTRVNRSKQNIAYNSRYTKQRKEKEEKKGMA